MTSPAGPLSCRERRRRRSLNSTCSFTLPFTNPKARNKNARKTMSAVLDTPTLDAQMSDYLAPGDPDVLMQTHSTDAWTTQDDGRMVEDSSFSMVGL